MAIVETFGSVEQTYHPRDWQLEEIKRMAARPHSADWSEMGCYKTTTALWLAKAKKAKSVLIITSKNGKGTYFDAVPKSLPGWTMYNVTLKKTTLVLSHDFQVEVDLDEVLEKLRYKWHSEPTIVLIHYDCFSPRHSKKYKIRERFAKIKWDFIACDEAHKLKNRDTGWTKEIKKLSAKHRHLMTGTGFVNNPAEIWSLLDYLRCLDGPNRGYWNFRNHFCNEYLDGRGFRVITGLKKFRIQEFRNLRISLGPRKEMTEVNAGIAEPIIAVREVDLNATQRKMYNEIMMFLHTLDQAGEPLTSPNVLSQLNRLRQISVATPSVISREFNKKQNRMVTEVELVEPSSKLDEVMSLLEEIRWDDEIKRQVVIFSNFKDPLNLLESRFEDAEIPYLHMTANMSEAKRYNMWHDLFPKKQHRVFMSTLALGGESINLASANYLIFLDRSWSPKDMTQAIGRVYRPGQTGVPEIIYINARNTVDGYVESRLKTKQGWFNDIFGK